MDAALPVVFDLVVEHGLWILFVMAVLETCFVTGLVVPSGVATSIATVLALEGELQLGAVAGVAVAGGFAGDSIGFWIGRLGSERLRGGRGFAARILRRHQRTTGRFLGRHPTYSVTVARLVSFVRTLMPMAAGMSGLSWPRYLAYEVVGVSAWAAMYMGIGFFARESWQRVTSIVGVGWTVFFVLAGGILWIRARGRRGRPSPPEVPAEEHP